MKIAYLGHACFKIVTADNITIITDPYTNVGYELPNDLYADIVTVSHEHFDHNYVNAVQGNFTLVTNNASVNGISITAIPTWHDPEQGRLRGENNVYVFSVDGMKICHLGDYGETDNSFLAERLQDIDVCLLPIGGTYTIDAKQAKTLIETIQPKLVIPMHYKPIDGELNIADEKEFLQLFSPECITRRKGEIQLLQKDLPQKGTKIILMERI